MFWNSLITILLVGAAAVWWASRIDTGVKKYRQLKAGLMSYHQKLTKF